MGAIAIKTTEEMDLFLLEKRLELNKQGIKIKGNNRIILHLIETAMNEKNKDK